MEFRLRPQGFMDFFSKRQTSGSYENEMNRKSIDRTLSVAITTGLSGSGSDGKEGVLRIPQSFSITGASTSDCFV